LEVDDGPIDYSTFDMPRLACCMALKSASSDPREDRQELITRNGLLSDGTCSWILRNEAFQSWLNSTSSRRLWIPGSPGKGKTVLATVVTEYLETRKDENNFTLLEYYFNNTDTARNNATSILRSLIFLILEQRPKTFKHIPKFDEKLDSVAEWPLKTLCRIFRNMVKDPDIGEMYFILDALDECVDGRDDLISVVRMLGSHSGYPAKNIRILVLSRHHPTSIEMEFSSDPTIKLEDEHAVVEEVKRFISDQIDLQYPTRGLEDTWPSKLKAELLRKAEGTFLWAGFALKELKRVGGNRTKSEKALANIPIGLNAIYERILMQIEDSDRIISESLLECLVIAHRPLTVPELAAALPEVIIASQGLNKYDVLLDHINSCGSILEVIRAPKPRVVKDVRMRRQGKTTQRRKKEAGSQSVNRKRFRGTILDSPWHWMAVRLVHGSAKDYFLNIRSSEKQTRVDLQSFAIDPEQAHMKIIQRCLGYVTYLLIRRRKMIC
jgi:hypothetical protein